MENGTSLSKSHLGKINLWDVQLSTSGWKECRRHRTFPVTRRLSTNRVPKKEEKEVFLGNLNPYWKPFWNMKQRVASHHLDTCSWNVWRKSIQGKWQKWCVVHVPKNASATHFCALSQSLRNPYRDFAGNVKGCLFRPQPQLPSFIQIHPSFLDLLAKMTFQIVTIIGDPIGNRSDRISDRR